MVKLNNKGFGMANLIAFICIFLVILIAVAVLSFYYYGKDYDREEIKENHTIIEST